MGFDTPEVFSPSCITEFWLGTQATWTLRKKLWFAKDVDIVLGGQDRYERRLATLLIDGKSVAEAMISLGLAKPYRGGQRSGWC
ncbi:MAG: thermonuclease family protein [Paracoccaceae bacterium]